MNTFYFIILIFFANSKVSFSLPPHPDHKWEGKRNGFLHWSQWSNSPYFSIPGALLSIKPPCSRSDQNTPILQLNAQMCAAKDAHSRFLIWEALHAVRAVSQVSMGSSWGWGYEQFIQLRKLVEPMRAKCAGPYPEIPLVGLNLADVPTQITGDIERNVDSSVLCKSPKLDIIKPSWWLNKSERMKYYTAIKLITTAAHTPKGRSRTQTFV